MTTLDLKERIEAERACDVPGGFCTLDVTTALLRAKLRSRGAEDTARVSIQHNDFRGASHPYLASVRVADREVFRIMRRPDEVFAEDVLDDIVAATRRPAC